MHLCPVTALTHSKEAPILKTAFSPPTLGIVHRSRSLGVILAILSFVFSSSSVIGQADHESTLRNAIEKKGSARVVITFDRDISAPLRGTTLEHLGTLGFIEHYGFRHAAGVIGIIDDPSSVASLFTLPGIHQVALDEGGEGSLATSVPFVGGSEWHGRGVRGDGVTVAILDSGLDADHPDLASNLSHEACFLDTDGAINFFGSCPNGSDRQFGTGAAVDDHGHGSNVTGIVAASGEDEIAGMAPDAKILAVKVLDDDNAFSFTSEIAIALEYILLEHPDVSVVNMSLGTFSTFSGTCDFESPTAEIIFDIVDALRARGTFVVASAGNNGSRTKMPIPACVSNVYSVAASDFNDQLAGFSNVTPETDLAAPGVSIRSASLTGGTSTYSGTSQASPHVAGCAALLISDGTAVAPTEIEAFLASTDETAGDNSGGSLPRLDCFVEAALPVELTSFSATVIGAAGVRLEWTTSSEHSNAGFEVWLNSGPSEPEQVAFISGAGESTAGRSYSHTLERMSAGTHRFHLVQRDLDGTTTRSGTVTAQIDVVGRLVLGAPFPNPGYHVIEVDISSRIAGTLSIKVWDALGRLAQPDSRITIQANETERYALNVGDLSPGLYIVEVIGQEFVQRRSFLVQ